MLISLSGAVDPGSTPTQSLYPGNAGGAGGRASRSQSQLAAQLRALGAHTEHPEAGW